MNEQKIDMKGFAVTTLAFILWGVLPIYWKLLQQVPAQEILAHRIFWSLLLTGFILSFLKNKKLLATLKRKNVLISAAAAGTILGINWFTYIWAVNSGHIVQSSLGYYINPLFTITFGMIFFKEKLSRIQAAALVLAAIGVMVVTLEYGAVPWVALILAVSFALYGTVKKASKLDSLSGLFMETLFLAPLATGYILFLAANGEGSMIRDGWYISVLLAGCGFITSLPLFLFGMGAQRIPLVSVGFLQYIAPTLMLLIGVFGYKEPFTLIHAISFGCIWAALALYSFSLLRAVKKRRGHKTEKTLS
jgi:chloramphenicol-sensitive protein RarD